MKIVFFGSDDFAAVHLEALLAAGHQVLGCVTGPDKPQGRGMKVVVSPIKELGLAHQLPCLQPLTLKDRGVVDALRAFHADVFVVVAYGRLLTQEVLDIPRMLCLNVHGSLLPRYRGAAPVHWAVLNGEKQTGVTVQKMALALDAGDIVAQEIMDIGEGEDAHQLRQRMARVGAALLVKVLGQHPSGDFPLVPQDEAQVTYAPKLTKEMGQIDWAKTAGTIFNQVRGLQPWPGAYTFYKDKTLKVVEAVVTPQPVGSYKPGQVIKADKEGLSVACSQGVLRVTVVHPEAGKVMPAASFAAGQRGMEGVVLG